MSNKISLVNKKPSGGKNIRNSRSKIDAEKYYSLSEALVLLKESSYVKFDETVEVVFKLGVDPRHSDQVVRGVVSLPSGTGKKVRVAVICKDELLNKAKESGADIVGSVEVIDAIKAGKIDFDICITTPDMMVLVSQVARILGPKGLMPNPKLGTVTSDISSAVSNAKNGQVEYRVDKAGIIHAGIGKISFNSNDLEVNIKAVYNALLKAKPAGAKGSYMNGMYLSSTMGPSIRVDLSSLI